MARAWHTAHTQVLAIGSDVAKASKRPRNSSGLRARWCSVVPWRSSIDAFHSVGCGLPSTHSPGIHIGQTFIWLRHRMSSCMPYPLGLHLLHASDIHHASRHARPPAAIQRFERTGHLASTARPQEMAVGAGFRINPCHGLLQMFQMDDGPLAWYMSQSSDVTPASIYFTRWM